MCPVERGEEALNVGLRGAPACRLDFDAPSLADRRLEHAESPLGGIAVIGVVEIEFRMQRQNEDGGVLVKRPKGMAPRSARSMAGSRILKPIT